MFTQPALLLYHHFHFSWLLFAILFLTPDLFIPVTLFLIAYATQHPPLVAIAIIWIAHIAFDRLLNYGLKYPTFFKDTHLQHIP